MYAHKVACFGRSYGLRAVGSGTCASRRLCAKTGAKHTRVRLLVARVYLCFYCLLFGHDDITIIRSRILLFIRFFSKIDLNCNVSSSTTPEKHSGTVKVKHNFIIRYYTVSETHCKRRRRNGLFRVTVHRYRDFVTITVEVSLERQWERKREREGGRETDNRQRLVTLNFIFSKTKIRKYSTFSKITKNN